jgi:hypothetical protein
MASAKAGIVGTLLAATAFAAALGGYLYHAIPSKEELLAESSMSPATSAAFAGAESLDARVKAAASAVVGALADGRSADAYALMAAPYRAAVDEAAFARACGASPFLSTARSIAIYQVRETIAPGGQTGAISATGVLASTEGAVPVRMSFLAERGRSSILSVVVADAPVLTTAVP